VERLISWEI